MHFHREKLVPHGGPDGGNGGKGGDVVLRGNDQLWTLLHLKYRKHVIASSGAPGEEQDRTGADGRDEIIEVPLGTVARKADSGEIICEINRHGEEHVLTPGGRGGKGNAHFATPTNQAPQYAQPGEPGREQWIVLELKLLADVGLVGFPNAGKSTLLSVVSAAKPKIADYPFTTLTPNLGVVSYRDDRSFVMADIPGIIEGAAEGKGLGIRFLRHIERNPLLLFVVPADANNIAGEYKILLNELEKYNPELLDKRRLLAVSKSDMLDEELTEAIKGELPDDIPSVFISAITGKGLTQLKDLIWKNLH
jgi:GTP-binding protein